MPNRPRLPDAEPTKPEHFFNRRQFIKIAAIGGAAVTGVTLGYQGSPLRPDRKDVLHPGLDRPELIKLFPVERNRRFDLKGKLTHEMAAGTYNNFYEFYPGRAGPVWKFVDEFEVDPWTIEVTGACRKPRKFGIEDIFKQFGMHQEERTYRFRCVERWAMDVPWTGFELNRLLKSVEPTSDAKFVRFVTAHRPRQMPGIRQSPQYPWPYFEGLRMDEAMNELTLLVTGVYGRLLPRQHGAPFRLIVPWKYGYKSAKSIVRIELLGKQPPTFWNTVSPHEYGFLSNINPKIPHPRWSQAMEWMLDTREQRPTLVYGGYGEHVAKLYG